MKNKIAYLLLVVFMLIAVVACNNDHGEVEGNYTVIEEASENVAHVKTDKYFYNKEDTIKVYNYNASKEDFVCLLGPNDEPVKVNRNLRSKTNTEVDEFSVSDLIKYSTGVGYGEYSVCLYDANYSTLYRTTFFVLDGDRTDYSPKEISFIDTVGIAFKQEQQSGTFTYKLYWAKDGVRLNDYTAIKTFTATGYQSFPVLFNQNMYAPKEANQIELVVMEGYSQSLYLDIPEDLYLPEGNLLYSFNVLTDIHAYKMDPTDPYTSHFINAFKQVEELNPNSVGIYTVGDNTGNGKDYEYDILNDLLAKYKKTNTPIYYAMGNHDYMYYETFEEGLNLFKNKLNVSNHYYSFEVNGSKVIMLSSETTSVYGSMKQTQLDWLKKELQNTDPNKPIFIMIHQPLKNTVAGTLVDKDPNQTAYGFTDGSGSKFRDIIRPYTNAFVFFGHSHWTMDSEQSTYVGKTADANFINCSSVAAPEDGSGTLASSQGVFVEVYDNHVVIKGRDFVKNAWISTNQIVIPITK